MAAMITCPSCRKSLQVPDELLGQRVQCPECKHVFVTEAPPARVGLEASTVPPPIPSPPPPLPPAPATVPPPPSSPPVPPTTLPPSPPVSTAPSKPPVWEKPDPLQKRRRRNNDDDEDDDDEDDDDDDRPRRRRRRRRRSSGGGSYLPPHRGGLILALGILSFFVPMFGLVMGATVWSMANNDLRAMREGNMDPSGEGPTRVGQVFAIIATLVWMIPCMIVCSLGAFTGLLR